jgi:tetratricopeptide (TPR) repeat protein
MAWAYFHVGRPTDAGVALDEALHVLRRDPFARAWALPEIAVDLERVAEAREILEKLPPSTGRSAMLALLDGRFEEAADHYAAANILLFEAEARLRAGKQLVASARREDAQRQLERGLAFFRSAGASIFVEEAERLVVEAAAA